MPWVKLQVDLIDDPRLLRVSESARWLYVALYALAGKCDAEGRLVHNDTPLTSDDLATRLRTKPSKLRPALDSLKNVGLLTLDGPIWCVTGFSEVQGRPHSERRAAWRDRKRAERSAPASQEWQETPEELQSVTEDSEDMSKIVLVLEERERRGEEDKDNAGKPAAEELSEGQRLFLQTFRAKRFKTDAQKSAVGKLAQEYPQAFPAAVEWTAKRGMNMGAAILSLEKALPKWGTPNSRKPAGQHEAAGPWRMGGQ